MQENNNNNQKQGGLSWSTPAQSPMPVQKPVVTPKVQVMPPKPASNSTKYIGMIVLGVIAGVVIAWGWSALRAPKESAATPSNTSASASADKNAGAGTGAVTTLGSGADFSITSPQIAGNSVVIAKATVSVPTWIVIYENNNGAPGNALGAGLFFPENQGGTVELLRGTSAGKSYLATEQIDNGDRKFSLKDDQFLKVEGVPQWVTFEVR